MSFRVKPRGNFVKLKMKVAKVRSGDANANRRRSRNQPQVQALKSGKTAEAQAHESQKSNPKEVKKSGASSSQALDTTPDQASEVEKKHNTNISYPYRPMKDV